MRMVRNKIGSFSAASNVTGILTDVPGVTADSFTLTPSYRRALDLFGDAGTFLIGIPVGRVSGTVTGLGAQDSGIGQGDMFIGGTIGGMADVFARVQKFIGACSSQARFRAHPVATATPRPASLGSGRS